MPLGRAAPLTAPQLHHAEQKGSDGPAAAQTVIPPGDQRLLKGEDSVFLRVTLCLSRLEKGKSV